MQRKSRAKTAQRALGRPVGADSARTRKEIVRAAREVLNERGYSGMTFQAIAKRTGLSRPTLHYYFAGREDLYVAIVEEARSVIAHCATVAVESPTLLGRLTAFVDAIREVDTRDRSMMPFLISARLEYHRNPELQATGDSPIRPFLCRLVDDAVRSGELSPDTEVEVVADMLQVTLYGMAFHAAFTGSGDLGPITRQLIALFARGLVPAAGDE
ncbi:TetR/AcrR family transcriptional regulator [Mycolicibacterium sp. S2-37]|uniref:TetR/AcrR family transcriptional regulator n=1 Tax=Mycolicibacterium sp. S2-37 TaxID=2810297 RepID=UPI001A947688|nr:TetR/AcrR family transcriptional regulator [Mycolicibacterium sp. S2-37]MBO0676395.1 TetR/AcrR family transcriptional regulator [Mycolicibacterium sp. S2-37]